MTNPKPGGPLIGVTGTSGKTSTILMLDFILAQCGRQPASLDTWKGPLSYEAFRQDAIRKNSSCMVVEAPLEALRQHHLSGSMFQACALTNLSLDHLSSCHTPEQYYGIKTAFIQSLPPEGKVVLPADDLQALTLTAEGHPDFISFGIQYPHAMVMARNIQTKGFRSAFDLTVEADILSFSGQVVPPGSAAVTLPMAGEHNISNALAAVALSLLFNVDLDAVANALKRFPGIRRNMEPIASSPCKVIDDGARNPQSIRASLAAAAAVHPGRILVLHGIYGGGGQAVNACNAREFAAWLQKYPENKLFITRSMYHSKNRHRVHLCEERAFLAELREHGADFAYFPDLPDACESILTQAGNQDLVMILGGPVLNRAREVILQATGEKRASHTLVPADLPLPQEMNYRQAVLINPT